MPFLHPVLEGGVQHAETIFGAAAEVDRGGLREIFGGTGHLRNLIAGVENLVS